MCIYKQCPIFDRCDKEIDQVVYCRHVEMIKKIGLVRHEIKKKNDAAAVDAVASQVAQIQVAAKTVSEPSETATMVHASSSTMIN